MAWKLCGRSAMTWITEVGVRFGHLFLARPYQLCKPSGNNKHRPQTLSNGTGKEKCFCSPRSNLKWSDFEVLEKWWRFRTGQPEYINFSGVLWMESRPEAREDGWNCLACLHTKVFGRVMWVKKKKKKTVYWPSTLCVSLKCNHNPSWAYLSHIQATHSSCGSLLFINI